MKRIIYIVFGLLLTLSNVSAQETVDTAQVMVEDIQESRIDEIFSLGNDSIEAAIKAYNDRDFHRSIDLMKAEINSAKKDNLESAMLYYNLGNAYYRINELGHARLNYERAALLVPNDRDINHNIKYITTRIEDKILEVDTLLISQWVNDLQNTLSAKAWSIVGICFFLLLVACLVIFFFTQQILFKKTSFYIAIVALSFLVVSNVFALRQKDKVENRNTAIIMSASATVLSSPDINSKELFRLHVGTKVYISKDDRNWLEIEIADGSVGWIQRENLEII